MPPASMYIMVILACLSLIMPSASIHIMLIMTCVTGCLCFLVADDDNTVEATDFVFGVDAGVILIKLVRWSLESAF